MSKKRKGYCRRSAYKRLAMRDGERCKYCASVPLRWEHTHNGTNYCAVEPRVLLHVEHVFPIVDGGDHSDANLQLLCEPCHAAKTAAEHHQRRMAA